SIPLYPSILLLDASESPVACRCVRASITDDAPAPTAAPSKMPPIITAGTTHLPSDNSSRAGHPGLPTLRREPISTCRIQTYPGAKTDGKMVRCPLSWGEEPSGARQPVNRGCPTGEHQRTDRSA